MRLFIFGFGFSAGFIAQRLLGRGWTVAGTARREAARADLARRGVTPIDPGDRDALAAELARADAVLVSAPPDSLGCPGYNSLRPLIEEAALRPDFIGYLSTTGVYGDREGGWVNETSELLAPSPEGARRVAAEAHWRAFCTEHGLPLAIFRLPGIYGPGRSPFERLRSGSARRFDKPGQVFSRIHVEDLAEGVIAALRRPRLDAIYNLCDDRPCSASEVTEYAASLIGLDPPPLIPWQEAEMEPQARRFYAESKRISNARAKAELGWRPLYPTDREGLAAVLSAEQASVSP